MVAAYVGEEEAMFRWKEKHKKGGKVNMCQGLREWLADERMEGIEEGRAEGKAEGIAEGRVEGKAEGIAEGKAEAVVELLSEYGPVSEELKGIIMKEKDIETLRTWLKLAIRAESAREFERKLVEIGDQVL